MLRISQIKINISEFYHLNREKIEQNGWEKVYGPVEYELVLEKVLQQLHCAKKEVREFNICKRSIDARKKQEIFYNYSVDVRVEERLEQKLLKRDKKKRLQLAKSIKYCPPTKGERMLKHRPVIIGFGPAGMFAGLELAKAGYEPIILEQGQDVDGRIADVEQFWKTGQMREKSNVQFGEGGAGTFSDGKLNTSVKDPTGRNRKVLEIFVEHGADPSILYEQKPHIGTDVLCGIVKRIRLHIEQCGGQVRFGACVTDLHYEGDYVTGVEINQSEILPTEVAIFAIGHSARDTFAMLHRHKVFMEQKPFAIGVRVEHKQNLIDQNQYGELAGILPAADYKLTYQAQTGRSIFSFCMCPGGFVVNASSEDGRLVVNGMSNQGRNEENANSALVVNISPEDFEGDDVLAGVEFQRKWEQLAYQEGNGKIPVQLFVDFREERVSTQYGGIQPVHKGTSSFGNLWNCLPQYVCHTLVEGIEHFGRVIGEYDNPDTLLSGVETRTSSPVRIVRDEDLESNMKGIYPCGEGAGYAGGITSAAIDGLKVYEAIRSKYKPLRQEEEYE